jgi:hypothetical protein
LWCVNFHHEGVIYRGEWDLHRLGEVSLVPGGGRPTKPRGRPTEWSGLQRLSPPTRASPPRVDTWQPRLGLNRLKPWYTCQIHPRGEDDFDIWSTLLCHHLKCSNLVPKFLKSNKHYNHGTRLVDKVNTWLFHTFTRHVGA